MAGPLGTESTTERTITTARVPRPQRQSGQPALMPRRRVDVLVRADTHAQALVSASVAAATVCELAHAAGAGLDFGHVALVVRKHATGADAFA
jgi:hypothetical protein